MGNVAIFIGRQIVGAVIYLYGLLNLLRSVLGAFFTVLSSPAQRVVREITLKQIIFTAIDAVVIVSFIALGMGGVVIIQTFTQLSKFGAADLIGKILVIVFIREFSSVFTALLIISRSGSAMTTEIGNMKVSQEIDAIESMGIDPVQFLVLPRTIAVVTAMLCLTVYFNLAAVLGGYIVTLAIGVDIKFFMFLENFFKYLTIKDIIICSVKSLCFGLVIPLVGCFNGLSVRRSPTEVPAKTTKTVMEAVLICILVDALLTAVSYIYL